MLSVVIPAYNEGGHIYENLGVISNALSKLNMEFEIVPVNDGSSDNTHDEVMRAANDYANIAPVSYEKNRGKGGAIIAGIEAAKGDIIGFLDADLDISPDHYLTYVPEMINSKCDIVIGSKMHKDSRLEYPNSRKVFSFCYYIMLKVLFGLKCKDTQTGIKIYRANLIKEIATKLRTRGFAFDIEILAIAARKGAVIREMPVEIVFKRGESFGRIKFKDIWKMFTDTISIWWNLRIRKVYDK